MSEEPPLSDFDDRADPEADAELRRNASRRRRLLVGGAAAIIVLLVVLGTVLGGSLRDVPWLAVVGLVVLLAAIWHLEGRRIRGS